MCKFDQLSMIYNDLRTKLDKCCIENLIYRKVSLALISIQTLREFSLGLQSVDGGPFLNSAGCSTIDAFLIGATKKYK